MRDYFDPNWAEFAFGLLFTATWQAAAVAALAAVASRLTRHAVARSQIWSACVIALAAAPIAALLLPHVFVAYSGPEPLHFPSCIARPHTADIGATSLWAFTGAGGPAGVCRALVICWLMGVAVALARFIAGWLTMLRLLRRARPCYDPRVAEIVSRLVRPAEQIGVLELDGLVSAVCWQIHRPKIILGAETDRLSVCELEMMISHELAHVRRSDPAVLFVQRLVEVVYWFHPAVWWVSMQTAKYREFVCDDLVVAAGRDAVTYAKCLGQLALWSFAPMPVAPAGLGMVRTQHMAIERVRRMLDRVREPVEASRGKRLTVHAAAALAVLVVGVGRVEPGAATVVPGIRCTAWPPWSARMLDTIGVRVRDFPLDGHRYDPKPRQQAALLEQ